MLVVGENMVNVQETCGPDGLEERIYTITTEAANGGQECDFSNGATQTQPCNTEIACSVDCAGEFNPCTTSCVKQLVKEYGMKQQHKVALAQLVHNQQIVI